MSAGLFVFFIAKPKNIKGIAISNSPTYIADSTPLVENNCTSINNNPTSKNNVPNRKLANLLI